MSVSERPIFLIEDNPMDVDLTRRAFARHNVANPFTIARDGEEALAYLDNLETGDPSPLVILLDLKLPKVDGLEVLRYLKTNPRFQMVPVVVLTTSSEDSDVQVAYREGANSYIVKPVDFDKFNQVVDKIHSYWCELNVPPG
ncbi:MAG: response regulator [Anaerolineales bacterium]|nr:response regulator [Anaerolineales bacterium]